MNLPQQIKDIKLPDLPQAIKDLKFWPTQLNAGTQIICDNLLLSNSSFNQSSSQALSPLAQCSNQLMNSHIAYANASAFLSESIYEPIENDACLPLESAEYFNYDYYQAEANMDQYLMTMGGLNQFPDSLIYDENHALRKSRKKLKNKKSSLNKCWVQVPREKLSVRIFHFFMICLYKIFARLKHYSQGQNLHFHYIVF